MEEVFLLFIEKLLVKVIFKFVFFGLYMYEMLLEIFDIIDELVVLNVYVIGGSGGWEILKIFDVIDEVYNRYN